MMPFTPALWHSRKLFSINDRKSDQNLIKRRRMIYFILIRIHFNVQLKINYRVIFWNCISGLFLKNIHTMNLAYLDYFCLNLCLIIFALNYLKNVDTNYLYLLGLLVIFICLVAKYSTVIIYCSYKNGISVLPF